MIILGLTILACTIIGVFIVGKLVERHHKDIKATLLRQIELEERMKTGQLRKLRELGRELDQREEHC